MLIIEDSEDDALLIERELTKNGYDLVCKRIDTPEALQNELIAKEWDIVIADFVMPRFSGLDALKILKDSKMDIPFIVVSGKIGEETAVEAMRAGAQDYIIKGNLARLAPVVERELADAEVRRKRRQAEEDLELLHNTLESRANEMVSDQRRKDQAMIQQSRMAAMGEMIGNIAHQWRQPLNNLGLIIQGLQMAFNSGKLTSYEMESNIHEAMKTLMHMSHTIDDFRNFFREDKEKQEFIISKAVNRAVLLVSSTLSEHNIQVEIDGDETVTVNGYQNEYAQVLLNIISNSRDAGIERNIIKPVIFIRITMENGRSVLYISDNCGGIQDDVMSRIFDPYFTTRGLNGGTGIGLYMSKMIIEQNMGGHLTVGNVDGGAEFRIEV